MKVTQAPRTLLANDERRLPLKRAYYVVLCQEPDFVEAIDALLHDRRVASIDWDGVASVVARSPGRHFAEPDIISALYKNVPAKTQEATLRFAQRWHFPGWSHDDVIDALLLGRWLGTNAPPSATLPVVPEEYLRARIPLSDDQATKRTAAADIRVGGDFRWRAYEMSRKDAAARAEEILANARADVRRQLDAAEALFRGLGYSYAHPQRESLEQLTEIARRTFRRAHRRWEWKAIAEAAGVSTPAAFESVTRFAEEIWIKLPAD